MISYRFIAGQSKTGYPQQTLLISTDNPEIDTLTDIANYLIDNVFLIYHKNNEIDGDVMWPIKVALGKNLTLNESTFWNHLYQSVKGAYQYLLRYINALYELSKETKFNMLLMSNEYQYHGGLALNQYWLWNIEGTDSSTNETIEVLKYFNLWLSKNDLEFEVSQDDLINLIMQRFGNLSSNETATLLALRLNDGQITDKDFEYLKKVLISKYSKGLLKQVINQLVNSELHLNGPALIESTIYELCAIVYGSNKRCTEHVINYARTQADNWCSVDDFEMKKINYLRQVGDIYWQQVTSQDRYIDTSFHLFDTHTKKWIDYSEREDD